jgi:hypothetical protein
LSRAVHIAKQNVGLDIPRVLELREAMASIAPKKGDNIDPDNPIDNIVLGRWFRSNNGRSADKVRFTNKTSKGVVISHGSPVWWIEHENGEEAAQDYRKRCLEEEPF